LELGFWILDFGFSTRDFRSLASPFIPDAGASAMRLAATSAGALTPIGKE
jgi:hypothetical protein